MEAWNEKGGTRLGLPGGAIAGLDAVGFGSSASGMEGGDG
jgi:hypothetical protein